MAKNQVLKDARHLTVTVASKVSGDPVLVGAALTGVALTDTGSDGKLVIDTEGAYDLSVKGVDGSGNSAVAAGDIIYYVEADTPKLSKKATGVKYGVALEAVTSGATATIQVKLGKF